MHFTLKNGIQVFFDPFTGVITDNPLYKGSEQGYLDIPPIDKSIQGFIFVLTTRCNLNCAYCYSIRQNTPATMQPDDPVKILKAQIRKETQTLFINFFGGEPTLEFETIKNTIEYLNTLKEITIFSRVTTNGTTSKEKLNYFIDNNLSIVISSDGLPDKSSGLIKQVIANKVEKNIKYLVKKNAVFRVRATLTTENLPVLSQSLHYWKNLGVEHVHIEPYHPIGHSKEELSLLPDKKEFVQEFVKALKVAEELCIWIQTGAFMNLLTPSSYFCTGASGKFRVYNPDGSVTSCYRVQSFENKNNFFVIDDWKKAIETKKLYINPYAGKAELLHKHSVYDFENCDNCEAKYICAGGCLMRNKEFGGDINSPDEWICYVRRNLLKYGIIQTWEALKINKKSIVFGRFVFENEVIIKTAVGNTELIPKLFVDKKKNNKKNQPFYNMFDVLGIKKSEITSYYQKISRAECL